MKKFLYLLVKSAGKILLKYFNSNNLNVEYKSKNNPVTIADKETEYLLKNLILKKFPNDKFICEESCSTKVEINPSKRYWIIDPLDGTVNFTKGLNIFCTSIALMENNDIKYAIVYNPYTEELFYAQKNFGSFKNDKQIFVSKEKKLKNSLLVTGFPYYTHKNPKQVFDIFNKFSISAQGIRRLGSAAMDMCYVAQGVFDGFWEENLQPWDVAAGFLIVKEAGGKVTDYFGKNNFLFGKQLIASNNKIHSQMLKITKKIYRTTNY